MAQLDTATELYVVTRDPRYLRLMNLLFDEERPRGPRVHAERDGWDAQGGGIHP